MKQLTLIVFLTAGCGAADAPSHPAGQADAGVAPEAPAPIEEDPVDPFADVVVADIIVTVDYAGAAAGPLQVGAFTTYPPTGAPAAIVRVDDPVYPVQVTLKGLESGTWHAVAMVDQLPESPTLPGLEDPVGGSSPVDIATEDAVMTTVEIADPE